MLQLQAVLYGVLPVAAALVILAAIDLYRLGRRAHALITLIAGMALAAAALTDWQAAVVMLGAGLARWRFRASAILLLALGGVFGALSMMWAD